MNSTAKDTLPDDIELLKQMLLESLSIKEKLALELNQKSVLIGNLEETIRYLKHLKFGRSSEKFNDKQNDLFNEVEVLAAESEAEEAPSPLVENDQAVGPKKKRAKTKPRTLQQLPDTIERNEVFHDLPEAEKRCTCGCQLTKSGCERSEQLEVIPPQFSITVHVRHTYACKSCEGKLKTADKPAQPIAKSFATASLLAYIIVSKYLYALPLHRQEKIYESLKVPLKRNTMANWVIQSENLVVRVIERFEYYLLRENYLQCDETRLQVLNEPDKRADQISQMWVRRSMGDIPITLFNYSRSRSGDEACSFFKGYSGYLQTDDYAGYNKVVQKNQLQHVGCNAHARRKFDEAKKSEPAEVNKTSKKRKHRTAYKKYSGADMGLLFYRRLYAIEREIKTLAPSQRFSVRLEKSVPLFKRFMRWAELRLLKTRGKGKLGMALGYFLRNKEKLMMYCCDEKLNIDNNLTEGAIRPFVIGRKNWLFSSTPKGAIASAAFYSLIETAKANGLNVFDYLKHLFEVLPTIKLSDSIDFLLPWNVQLPE